MVTVGQCVGKVVRLTNVLLIIYQFFGDSIDSFLVPHLMPPFDFGTSSAVHAFEHYRSIWNQCIRSGFLQMVDILHQARLTDPFTFGNRRYRFRTRLNYLIIMLFVAEWKTSSKLYGRCKRWWNF
jgi:hypothetical protein